MEQGIEGAQGKEGEGMNGTGGDDPFMMAIRDCIKNVYEKEMKKMVGEYEICSCRVMVR